MRWAGCCFIAEYVYQQDVRYTECGADTQSSSITIASSASLCCNYHEKLGTPPHAVIRKASDKLEEVFWVVLNALVSSRQRCAGAIIPKAS